MSDQEHIWVDQEHLYELPAIDELTSKAEAMHKVTDLIIEPKPLFEKDELGMIKKNIQEKQFDLDIAKQRNYDSEEVRQATIQPLEDEIINLKTQLLEAQN